MHARALRLVIFVLFGSFPLSVAARRWIVLTCYDDPSISCGNGYGRGNDSTYCSMCM